MRILGVNLPDNERSEIGLTRIYGIGRKIVGSLLSAAGVDPDKRIRELTKQEVADLAKALEKFKVEGDLRKEVADNIERLKAIRCYRGIRHILNLPVRGQRTKSNARNKRGGKKTVGALSKEMWAKLESQQREAIGKK